MYCNGDSVKTDRVNIKFVKSVNAAGQGRIFGSYNMFDADLDAHVQNNQQPYGFFQDGYTVEDYSKFIENLPSDVATSFTNNVTGIPSDSAARHNKCIFTRVSITDVNYPSFVNPSRNVGHSMTGDKPLYGGIVAYSPLNDNPMVNAANPEGRDPLDNFDRSDAVARDRGGAPDLGAIEDYNLPAAGEVIYVTPDGAGRRDGSSWDNAIAGNAVYRLYGAPAAEGDSIDAANGARLVNKSSGDPVLTTDNRYCGGFARSYITSSKTGGVSTTTITSTWTTETIEYSGGDRDGEVETVQDNVLTIDSTTIVNSTGDPEEGFVSGWNDDTRYPYGEISGGSRSFWRANPYPSLDYGSNLVKFIDTCRTRGCINNARTENYVSGLQYAVEKASATNKTHHKDSVQVWVGAGEYTDYKGFVMRDSVTVYGGFPYGKYDSPGMTERQALMSNVINIPKSLPATDFNPAHYETILQISGVSPQNGNIFNADVVRFLDNDYSRASTTDTKSYFYKEKTIVHYKRYEETILSATPVTDTYMTMPNLDTIPVPHELDSISNGTVYYTIGTASASKDCWHLTFPLEQGIDATTPLDDKIDTVGGVLRWYDPYNEYPKGNHWKNVKEALAAKDAVPIFEYNEATGNWVNSGRVTTAKHLWLRDIPWKYANFWQTMKNVPAGKYRLKLDLGANFRENQANSNVGVIFYVKDSHGDTVVTQNAHHTTRLQARHFEFVFDQPEIGNLELRIAMDDASGTSNKSKRREVQFGDIVLESLEIGIGYNEYATDDDPLLIKMFQILNQWL